MLQNRYPVCYKDPDITDAEHLTCAAYHLIEAGRDDMAQALISQVCQAFRDIPVDPKQEPACKALGSVKYFPQGVITVPGPQYDLNVPAPAYDTDQMADMRRGASSRVSKACRQSCLSWFSSKQAEAAMRQKLPATNAFRPAMMLERIMKLCAGWKPDMPQEAAAVVAWKLYEVLDRNPIRSRHNSTVCMDLATHGTSYYSSCDEGLWGFKYLSESQVEAARDILSHDNGSQASALDRLSQSKITWNVCISEELNQIRAAIESVPDGTDICEKIPFVRCCRQAMLGHKPKGQADMSMHVLKEYVMDAFYAAIDVCNLIRCHEALRWHPDSYIHGVLAACRIISDSLDIPESLHLDVMDIMAARVFAAPVPDGHSQDCAYMAFSAVRQLSEMFGLPAAMDHPLLHPADDDV